MASVQMALENTTDATSISPCPRAAQINAYNSHSQLKEILHHLLPAYQANHNKKIIHVYVFITYIA